MFLAPIPFDYATLLDSGDRVRKAKKRHHRDPPPPNAATAPRPRARRRCPNSTLPGASRFRFDSRVDASVSRRPTSPAPWWSSSPKGRRGAEALEDHRRSAPTSTAVGTSSPSSRRSKFRWGPIQINWGGDVEVRIVCPPGATSISPEARPTSSVDGELGEVKAKSASGDLSLHDVTTELSAQDCQWRHLRRNDPMLEGTICDRVRVISTITLGFRDSLAARNAAVSSTSGDAKIGAIEAGELHLQTVSGDARIGVASGTRVWIDAVSVSGDLESELGLADQAPGCGFRPSRSPEEPSSRFTSRRSAATSTSCARPRRWRSVAGALAGAHELDDLVLASLEQKLVHASRRPRARAVR